jgi:3-keto-L-gulonate-6-phosphate decarboxylase
MDGVRKYVLETARQGGRVATVCSVAADASIRAAVAAGRECGVRVVSDLYAHPNGAQRVRELAAMGVDSAYIHYGADERTEDPSRDPLLFLAECQDAPIPIGVGTFSVEHGVQAILGGASIVAIGVPLILADDPEAELREYVLRVREAWEKRHGNDRRA